MKMWKKERGKGGVVAVGVVGGYDSGRLSWWKMETGMGKGLLKMGTKVPYLRHLLQHWMFGRGDLCFGKSSGI